MLTITTIRQQDRSAPDAAFLARTTSASRSPVPSLYQLTREREWEAVIVKANGRYRAGTPGHQLIAGGCAVPERRRLHETRDHLVVRLLQRTIRRAGRRCPV